MPDFLLEIEADRLSIILAALEAEPAARVIRTSTLLDQPLTSRRPVLPSDAHAGLAKLPEFAPAKITVQDDPVTALKILSPARRRILELIPIGEAKVSGELIAGLLALDSERKNPEHAVFAAMRYLILNGFIVKEGRHYRRLF